METNIKTYCENNGFQYISNNYSCLTYFNQETQEILEWYPAHQNFIYKHNGTTLISGIKTLDQLDFLRNYIKNM